MKSNSYSIIGFLFFVVPHNKTRYHVAAHRFIFSSCLSLRPAPNKASLLRTACGLSPDPDPRRCLSLFFPPVGKSVVSEPEDEVQEAEAGGGGLGVAAEEERLASHKPVEDGHEAVEPRGNRRHVGRLNTRRDRD